MRFRMSMLNMPKSAVAGVGIDLISMDSEVINDINVFHLLICDFTPSFTLGDNPWVDVDEESFGFAQEVKHSTSMPTSKSLIFINKAKIMIR